MLDALVLFNCFTVCGVWRCATQKLEEKDWWKNLPKPLRFFLHYYTIALVFFCVLVFNSFRTTKQAMLASGFFNPHRFLVLESVTATMTCFNSTTQSNSPVSPLLWTADQLHEIRFLEFGPMRFLLLLSCPVVVVTQISGWLLIFRHMAKIYNGKTAALKDNLMRDRAIQIMFLPVIYSLIAFNNVVRLMNLFSGILDLCRPEWTAGFEEKKAYTLSLYEANLSMADFYEAIALLQFTYLTIHQIKMFFRRRLNEKDKELGRLSMQSVEELDESNDLFRVSNTMSSLVLSGVVSFCVTCFLTFAFGVTLVMSMAYRHQVINPQSVGSFPSMLSGAGLLASTVAIGNVVTVEVSFHHELSDFKPAAKFWSTKIIVSIAFIQEALLGCLGHSMFGSYALSELQINLLYCLLLCYELLGITVLHIVAWRPQVQITPEERGTVEPFEYWYAEPDGFNTHHEFLREAFLQDKPLSIVEPE